MPMHRSARLMGSVAVALILAVGQASAGAEASRFRNMMPYPEARDMFQRLGYEPYAMPGADICNPDDPRCYPELEYCAKSRTWACTYTWRRGRTIIEVETRYDRPVVARSECVVNCSPAALREHRGGRTAAADLKPRPSSTD